MTKLQYIIASPRGDASESTALANTFLAAYRERHPDLEVDTLQESLALPLRALNADSVAIDGNLDLVRHLDREFSNS